MLTRARLSAFVRTLLTAAALCLLSTPVSAADGEDEGTQETPEQLAARKAKARNHFKRGLGLMQRKAWVPALGEFQKSREAYPTRVATNNAAIALRELGRYDDALVMFETLLRDFKLTDEVRSDAQKQIAEMRALVGTIDIVGAEPGARIMVSGKAQGEYPPVTPIRAAAGAHMVRLYKQGFHKFEQNVDVVGGRIASVQVKMEPLKNVGKLRVTERGGGKLEVIVDGSAVGTTPWEGQLDEGDHMVALRGKNQRGTQPTLAPVKLNETTKLSLIAVKLDSSLKVDPKPPSANVYINGVNVGRGVWLGRLKSGKHTVEVRQEGFITTKREVMLKSGERGSSAVELERDEDAPKWRKPSKWAFDLNTSVLIAPTFGGDVAGACDGACSRDVGLGAVGSVSATYELGSGLGFGLDIGYMVASQAVQDRAGTIIPNGLSTPATGTLDDDLRIHGFMAGIHASYHLGEQFPVLLGVGAGVLAGQFRDERSGTGFVANTGGDTYNPYALADFPSATYVYIDPGVRAGVRFLDHFELSGSIKALMLIGVEEPTWDASQELAAGSDGIGTYPADQLMGSFVLMVAPGVNLRYDFQ